MLLSKLKEILTKEDYDRYQYFRLREKSYRCRGNKSAHVRRRRFRIKTELIKYKGGKCLKCGYDKSCPGAYHFHHRNPSKKDFTLSLKIVNTRLSLLKSEVDKCDLLCSRCHAEVHDELYEENRKIYLYDYKQEVEESIRERIAILKKYGMSTGIRERVCDFCQCKFIENRCVIDKCFCSTKCANLASRRVLRLSKEDLLTLIEQKVTWLAIGKRCGVSDTAIKKWAIQYGIPIPKRRSERIPERFCERCLAEYKPICREQRFCSRECSGMALRKVERPTKKHLETLLQENSYCALGRRFGVRKDTIKKWAVRYGIDLEKLSRHTKICPNDVPQS